VLCKTRARDETVVTKTETTSVKKYIFTETTETFATLRGFIRRLVGNDALLLHSEGNFGPLSGFELPKKPYYTLSVNMLRTVYELTTLKSPVTRLPILWTPFVK